MFVEHKEAMEVTEAPVRTLKLSEAMRIGARLRPKCRLKMFHEGASCALGAAWEGMGFDPNEDPGTHSSFRDIGERLGISEGLARTITGKNDSECMTREQIADWLEAQGY